MCKCRSRAISSRRHIKVGSEITDARKTSGGAQAPAQRVGLHESPRWVPGAYVTQTEGRAPWSSTIRPSVCMRWCHRRGAVAQGDSIADVHWDKMSTCGCVSAFFLLAVGRPNRCRPHRTAVSDANGHPISSRLTRPSTVERRGRAARSSRLARRSWPSMAVPKVFQAPFEPRCFPCPTRPPSDDRLRHPRRGTLSHLNLFQFSCAGARPAAQ